MTYGGSLTDLEAVRAFAASRDPRAFEVLLERYQRMVLATCLRVLGDRGHAEDATQETFLKLARHAGEITSNAGSLAAPVRDADGDRCAAIAEGSARGGGCGRSCGCQRAVERRPGRADVEGDRAAG
ncbi:MAG: sigma factor [Planctomycetota bacterium]